MDTVIKVEEVYKQYKLGLIGQSTVKEDINKGWNPGVGRSVGKYCFKMPVKPSCINQPKIKPKKIAKTPNSIKIKE